MTRSAGAGQTEVAKSGNATGYANVARVTRRKLMAGAAVLSWTGPVEAGPTFDGMEREAHERAMRLAIAVARRNPRFPFGAVIVRAADGILLAEGVNDSRHNPVLHGEIVCINAYVAAHGNLGWEEAVLYTTAEPCPMCMSALIWAGIGGVVYASPLAMVTRWSGGKPGIAIEARQVVAAAPAFRGGLLGGILQRETDALFAMAPSPG
jgi:tRNA(adenine34) deaminase